MKIILDEDDVLEILNEWCKKEHGSEIAVVVWEVEDDKKFLGVLIKT